MAKFPTYEEMGKKVAEKALDEFLYNGKSIREWIQIITAEDAVSRQAVEEMIKAEMPERGMCEIEGDKEKETVCEVCVDLMQKLSELPPVAPQPRTGNWIPVSERLPEFGQDVLLSLRSLDIKTGFRAETEPYFYCHGVDGCYIEPQNVLAWMPLPQPYKADKDYKAEVITRGNCMMCGKELTEGLFFCKECENKANSRK